jgi:hypothetical protein
MSTQTQCFWTGRPAQDLSLKSITSTKNNVTATGAMEYDAWTNIIDSRGSSPLTNVDCAILRYNWQLC